LARFPSIETFEIDDSVFLFCSLAYFLAKEIRVDPIVGLDRSFFSLFFGRVLAPGPLYHPAALPAGAHEEGVPEQGIGLLAAGGVLGQQLVEEGLDVPGHRGRVLDWVLDDALLEGGHVLRLEGQVPCVALEKQHPCRPDVDQVVVLPPA
jgi:hypothetical protein